MRDIVFVTIALAFFGLCYLYVLGCDRIVGRESPAADAVGAADGGTAGTDQAEPVVAP